MSSKLRVFQSCIEGRHDECPRFRRYLDPYEIHEWCKCTNKDCRCWKIQVMVETVDLLASIDDGI